jgi:hypothetical protein
MEAVDQQLDVEQDVLERCIVERFARRRRCEWPGRRSRDRGKRRLELPGRTLRPRAREL